MTLVKFRRSRLYPVTLALLGLSLCLTAASALDTIRPGSTPSSQNFSWKEVKSLVRDQRLELKVFVHLQKTEFKGFQASQDIQLKEWEAKEKKERHRFFNDHGAGAERRSYIQDFMRRREDLLRQMASDKIQKISDQSVKLKSFKSEQEDKIKKLGDKLREERAGKVKTVNIMTEPAPR